MQLRMSETTHKTWFRSERFALIGTDWFFETREGHNVGPFGSKTEAESGFQQYRQYIGDDLERAVEYAKRVAERGLWGITYCR